MQGLTHTLLSGSVARDAPSPPGLPIVADFPTSTMGAAAPFLTAAAETTWDAEW